MRIADDDDELRAAAFVFLSDLRDRTGGFVTRQDLRGFTFQGRRTSLEQNMRGIRVIAGYTAALTILTTFRDRPEDRPYQDDLGPDGYPRYKWRGKDSSLPDNVALRSAMEQRKPLAWFVGVAPGLYEALFPVWLVDEEPDEHQFVVALDDAMEANWQRGVLLSGPDQVRRREYALGVVRRRIHQPDFRRRVLAAYGRQCALCRLRHSELLDAAHIREDAQGGKPVVPNGIAMCAIHHSSVRRSRGWCDAEVSSRSAARRSQRTGRTYPSTRAAGDPWHNTACPNKARPAAGHVSSRGEIRAVPESRLERLNRVGQIFPLRAVTDFTITCATALGPPRNASASA